MNPQHSLETPPPPGAPPCEPPALAVEREIRNPLAAMVLNASAGLRHLELAPPDVDQARSAFRRIVRDGLRAGGLLAHLHPAEQGPGER